MSHIQERTEQETRNFFAKLKDSYAARFSNISTAVQREADGDSEDDTLIHRAFVKYFDSMHQSYPEWLGEKRQRPLANQYQSRTYQGQQQAQAGQRPRLYQDELQPVQVENNYSEAPSFQRGNSWSQGGQQRQETHSAPARTYTRSSSRLQDMYNRSREQSVPGAGYSSQSYQPARSNSASGNGSSSRLRDRILNTQTPPPLSGSQQTPARATWGRR